MRIAIMQPYFLPYAGYFRLFCGVDAFVVLDDAQFPRRGWVHRNRLRRQDGQLAWLSLPLQRAARETPIREMTFHARVDSLWPARARAFPACVSPRANTESIVDCMNRTEGTLTDYLARLLRVTLEAIDMAPPPIIRASGLDTEPDCDRAGRIIALCRKLGATSYVNAPRGRELYHPERFAAYGIELNFLPEYRGDLSSILQRLHDEPAASIRREIECNLV